MIMVHRMKKDPKLKTWIAKLLVSEKGETDVEDVSVTLGKASNKNDVLEAIRRNSKFFGKKVEVLAVKLVHGD